jgi:5-formyltetrahydrofolate cyclo-ligase
MTGSRSDKAKLRAEALKRRAVAHRRHAAQAAEALLAHGLDLCRRLPHGVVSGYLPIRNELDPQPLMRALAAQGCRLALPVIVTKWAPLTFRAWSLGDVLVEAEFGLREPAADAPEVQPDLLLVPLAAYDAEGFRIGYGGGYYDRTLALYRACRKVNAIGIAYREQEVPVFAHEPHDQRLDYLLSPDGLLSFGP